MSLNDTLKKVAAKTKADKARGPLWKGPEKDGVTFSMLSRYLVCKERFRLLVVEGLAPAPKFSHFIEFGNMWHICEEHLAGNNDWEAALHKYAAEAIDQYPNQQTDVDKWYNVCLAQFPHYVSYWKKHPDTIKRTPIFQEEVFDVPIKLPSGHIVRLRGKWDSVDLLGEGSNAGIYVHENKTRGEVVEEQIKRQMIMDLQTMIYVVALEERQKAVTQRVKDATWDADQNLKLLDKPIKGVRYNVIRRPLSGGKGTIKQSDGTKGTKCPKCKGEAGNYACPKCLGNGRFGGKPPETKEEYYARLAQYIEEEPETYFFRWRVEISRGDIDRFKRCCLFPILEDLCNWWEWVSGPGKDNPFHPDGRGIHGIHPFGIRNILDENGSTDLDEFLNSGSEIGLTRNAQLFKELQP